MVVKSTVLSVLLASSVSALSVPSAIQSFYNNVKNGGCKSYVNNRSNLNDGQGHSGFGFCADTANVIYLSGKNSLGDMDIDCDGAHNCGGKSKDFQSGTAFDDILSDNGYGIKTLDASVHSFAVLGTCHVDLQKSSALKPLALVAVVCNNQLFYSVWGDTNGCDNNDATGEASISLAQMCFPNEGLNGDNGHTDHDVLYLAFTGDDAVVGPNNANWKTKNANDFQASLKAFGDSVIQKKFGATPPTGPSHPPTSTPNPGTCSWAGHCTGAKCKSDDDCSDELTCKSGVCGGSGGSNPPPPPPTCSWEGHCVGAKCKSENDCSDELTCQAGKCAA